MAATSSHQGPVDVIGRHDAATTRSGSYQLIEHHATYTGSARARTILDDWAKLPRQIRQGDAGRIPPGAARARCAAWRRCDAARSCGRIKAGGR